MVFSTLLVPDALVPRHQSGLMAENKLENKSVSYGIPAESESADWSKQRIFGQRARRLVKMVSEAFLNPGKCRNLTPFNSNFIYFSVYSVGC